MSNTERLESFNPATGEVVGSVPITPVDAVADVVAKAHAAQPGWAALGAERRAEILGEAGPLLVERSEALGLLLTQEQGKPLREGIGEVKSCGRGLARELPEMVEALAPEILRDGRTRTTLYRDPFGVCACITPWNFPISMPHWLVIPALMAGNTVVLKPSEETPLIAQAYADLLGEVLPENVLQIIHGDEAQGKALVQANVDMITFTGSKTAGSHIMAAAAPDLKRVLLELGGKDPLIVLDDADINAAARWATRNSFRNAGQVCVSTERIYVREEVADAFEAAVVAQAQEMRVGAGTEEGVDVGPMVNGQQRDHVLGQITDAVEKGAQVLFGGEGHQGNYVQPTVLAQLDHGMDIMMTETFGPVACIVRVSDDDEAVRLANDSPFGLGAVVFGGDRDRAGAVARRLDAGMIGINRGIGGSAGAPWVGAKQSGYGYHSGRDGHRQFAQVRIITEPAPQPPAA